MKHNIMIVGEAWGAEEERRGQAFVGSSGFVLDGLLRQAGIHRDECYITNVFNLRPQGNKIETLCGPKGEGIPGYRSLSQGKYVLEKYQYELDRLWTEVHNVKPNVILALGNTPLWALCNQSGIKRFRGSPLPTRDGKHKVLPTWHPAAILRQWELRPVALFDVLKAKRESAFPEIRRPSRRLVLEPNLDEIKDFYNQHLKDQPYLSCDIETKAESITEVGVGTPDGQWAIIIPFWDRAQDDGNYWRTPEEERAAWNFVRMICAKHKLIGQNFAYDMQYFWRTMKIPCPQFLGDTMLLHHAMQPELEKSLGFLGSIYTNEPSWKFMRQEHWTLKQGDD